MSHKKYYGVRNVFMDSNGQWHLFTWLVTHAHH